MYLHAKRSRAAVPCTYCELNYVVLGDREDDMVYTLEAPWPIAKLLVLYKLLRNSTLPIL